MAAGAGTVLTHSEEAWERVWRINVMGTVHWVKAALPHMLAAGRGSIVTVASQLAFTSGGNNCAYIASKGAIVAFTRTTAVDFTTRQSSTWSRPPRDRHAALASLRPHGTRSRTRCANGASAAIPCAASACRTRWHARSRSSPAARRNFTTGTILMVDGGWTAA